MSPASVTMTDEQFVRRLAQLREKHFRALAEEEAKKSEYETIVRQLSSIISPERAVLPERPSTLNAVQDALSREIFDLGREYLTEMIAAARARSV